MSFRAWPGSYFEYSFFLRERWPRRWDYLHYDELWSLLAWLNNKLGPEDAADLSDKRRFHDRAAQAGLPIIPILAEFDAGAIVGKRSLDHSASDLFSKPADRWHGDGARLWQRGADGSYSGDHGSRFTLAEVYETLSSLSVDHPLILQPRITNHPELRPLAGRALSTVRVVTVRDTRGQIDAMLASFRMAVGSLVADNFAAGGLACPVDLDDGRLGSAVFKSGPGVFIAHPDSGAVIMGRRLPDWAEVKRLAVAAHREFKTLPTIGWDLAITEDGPVIVEGNSEWGTNVVQMAHQKPLEATLVPALIAEYFDQLAETQGEPCVRWER
jgi:hypothetical protein